ncbi:MAG: proteasome accessory factor PafA2 family protein, partial [Chthoniobacterales bacterium]
GVYQISQRADFFSVLVSIDTMNKRPLVNTRDEPHADVNRYRRFHVIVGDSNMSEWATALKVGTTALVLDLIENGTAPELDIAQPIDATKSISRDQTYDWIIELRDGRKISAIEVQRLYLRAAQKSEHAHEEDAAWLLREWENVLNDLERDVSLTRDRIDWVAKKFLLSAMQEEERLTWSDPWLQAIDLEYHNVAPDQGLFYELLRQGSMRRVVKEEEVKAAIFSPPDTTRAYFRGRSVAKFNSAITSIQWDEIVFANDGREQRITLPEVTEDDPRLRRLHEVFRTEPQLSVLLAANVGEVATTR